MENLLLLGSYNVEEREEKICEIEFERKLMQSFVAGQ